MCYGALGLFLIPPIIIYLISGNLDFNTWIYRALTFLVISCPCALVISIPLSFFGGIGGASKKGILIKGSNYLEALAKSKYVAFDKTGTMTKGIFEVSAYHECKITEQELLEVAAYAESLSNHPIGQSIVREYGKKIDKSKIESIEEYAGKGIKARIFSKDVLAGNKTFFDENHIVVEECKDSGAIVYVAIDGKYVGHLHVADIIKPTSKKCISLLKEMGIKKTFMLSGDNNTTAKEIGNTLGIDDTIGGLLPETKLNIAQQLIESKDSEKESFIFVGDGINDAAVISRADVGVSMGALGSDAAIEAADVVLMDDDPLKVVTAIRIAKKCMRIVYENIYFAIGVKVVCLILGALGFTTMWLAIFADVGVMIIAVLNALRVLNVRKL